MNTRFYHLFALAVALPLASCRFVGLKPDFSVMGDALSPVEADSVYVEGKPGGATHLAACQPATPAPAVPAATPTPPPAISAAAPPLFSQLQAPAPQARPQQQPATFSQVQPMGSSPAPAIGTYTVRPGDSLSRIARAHKVPLGSLAEANGIDLQNPLIKPGQQLRIPQGGAAIIAPPRSAVSRTAAAAPATPQAALTPAAPKPVTPAAARASKGQYRVCAGDTLYRIAQRHGITLQQLLKANNLNQESARRVRVGTLLTIPPQP